MVKDIRVTEIKPENKLALEESLRTQVRKIDPSITPTDTISPKGLFFVNETATSLRETVAIINHTTRMMVDAPNAQAVFSADCEINDESGQLVFVRTYFASAFEDARITNFNMNIFDIPSIR
jgi:hypothetical protein